MATSTEVTWKDRLLGSVIFGLLFALGKFIYTSYYLDSNYTGSMIITDLTTFTVLAYLADWIGHVVKKYYAKKSK